MSGVIPCRGLNKAPAPKSSQAQASVWGLFSGGAVLAELQWWQEGHGACGIFLGKGIKRQPLLAVCGQHLDKPQ